MYSLKFKVTTSTCDSEGRLKLYSALQMMQNLKRCAVKSSMTLQARNVWRVTSKM